MVNRLNALNEYYKKLGFAEVYLSIIPNPVTILYPNYGGYKYNNLIPRIESNPKLKMKCISVYDDFKNSKYQVYQNSDTHWCFNGLNLWLNKFSDTLQKY